MKINKCKPVLVYFTAFAILAACMPVFAGDSTLNVKCVDSSGNPIEKVKVEIFNLAERKMKDEKSDKQGIAEFKKLDDGVYRVWGRKDNFAPALYEFVVLKQSEESVTLELNPGEDKKFYFEDPAITQTAMQFSRQGLEAYKQQKFADAEKLFNQSLELDPSNPETLYYLSVALIQQGKFDQSEKSLNRTAEIVKAFMSLPTQPGQEGTNPYQQIDAGVQQLLKNLPGIRAETALKNKDYDAAVAAFKEGLKVNPDNPEYYANIAIALTNAKKFDEAIPYIDKAIQLKPDEKEYTDLKQKIAARQENSRLEQAQAIMDEGNKLLENNDAAAAVKKFEEALTMVPEDKQSPLWRQLAKAREKLDQSDAAVEAYKKALELAPAESVGSYRNAYAQYYLDKKEYEKAIDVLANPKTAGSDSVEDILMSLANSSKDNNPALAEAALERIIKGDPKNAEAYFEIGRMYYADGKEKDVRAKEVLEKYVEIGQDEQKIGSAKDLLIMIDRRDTAEEKE